MEPIDRWALARLAAWDEKVKAAYEGYEFHVAYHATMQFCAVELSSIYFDVLKDRLYTARRDGKPRRCAQTVLWIVAQDVMRLLAPILSFTAHEAWAFLPGKPAESVFLAGLPTRERPGDADALEARYGRLFEVRAVVQGKLEEARRAKLIGSGLEAMVTVRAEGEQRRLLEEAKAELPRALHRLQGRPRRRARSRRGRAGARPEVRALLDLRRGHRQGGGPPDRLRQVRGGARMRRPVSKWAVLAAIFVVGMGLDQWTKFLAVSRLTDLFRRVGAETIGEKVRRFLTHRNLESLATEPYYVFRPLWRMLYVENPNAAFGLGHFLSDGPRLAIFLVAAAAAAVAILYYFRKLGGDQRFLQVALALVLAGDLGNFIDRALRQLRHRLHRLVLVEPAGPALADVQHRRLDAGRRRRAAAPEAVPLEGGKAGRREGLTARGGSAPDPLTCYPSSSRSRSPRRGRSSPSPSSSSR